MKNPSKENEPKRPSHAAERASKRTDGEGPDDLRADDLRADDFLRRRRPLFLRRQTCFGEIAHDARYGTANH